MDIFYYMPLPLWKDMAERFLDPTSFGRLRQVNRTFRSLLNEESKEIMVDRCTVITCVDEGIEEIFLNTKCRTNRFGDKSWFKNGTLHRDGDLPAVILIKGIQRWYQDGKLHRDGDKPAVIERNCKKEWWKYGKLHRENAPAIVRDSGIDEWRKNGILYRDGALPSITHDSEKEARWRAGLK